MIGTPLAAVVDASVVVKWVVAETGSEAAVRLRGSRLFAPDLLTAECANILWKKVTRGDLLQADAEAAAAVLQAAPVERVPTRELLTAAVTLATTLGHPAYDCMYLLVAQQMGVPLVTADRRLATVARDFAERVDVLLI